MPANPDKHIERLYSVPPEEFVERRNELARSLRKDGDRQAADEVKALRKPTVPAWTVNQLARRERMRLRGLLTAGERLRKAHEDLLGGGSPEALQQARDDERKAIAELAGAAEALLEQAGHPASESTLDRVRATLHAAVVDEEVGSLVREGRLDKEAEAAGFGFGNLPPAPAARRGTRAKPARVAKRERHPKEPAGAKQERERKARQVEAAREERRQAEARLRDVRRAMKEAEQEVKSQARRLERAEEALRRRQAEVERAEREVERTRPSR